MSEGALISDWHLFSSHFNKRPAKLIFRALRLLLLREDHSEMPMQITGFYDKNLDEAHQQDLTSNEQQKQKQNDKQKQLLLLALLHNLPRIS